MRIAHPIFLACCVTAWARADAPEQKTEHTNFKHEVAAQFKFTPVPVETPKMDSSPALVKPVPVPAALDESAVDPDVVRMPAFTVMETIRNNNLHAAIERANAQARGKKVKFGTGVHELRLRRVSLYAITVFYVPIGFGLTW